MSWIQFSVETTRNRTEAVSEAFLATGALAISLQDAGGDPLLEPAPGEQPLWAKTRVLALYPADCRPEWLAARLRSFLQASEVLQRLAPLADRDWTSTWRDDFHAMCFGSRLWVCPTGEAAPDETAVTVQMNPGMAFGTGTHATTALCLQWLDANPPQGLSVIDYGCGSGILAIAACKLGATRVQAVDIDPQALQATRANAMHNGVAGRLIISSPQELAVQPVDLIMANILATPLVELAGKLCRHVVRRGRIVLTGILRDQAAYVMSAYESLFEFTAPVQREEWVLLEGVRKNAAASSGKLAE